MMKIPLTLSLLLGALCVLPAAERKRPNILMIFVDDMGWADFSCFGGKTVASRNIDFHASEGLRFTNFYVNSPICSPSRAATGYRAVTSLTFDKDGSSYMHGETVSHKEWLRTALMDQYLATIRIWREAEKTGALTPDIRARLQDWKKEFVLQSVVGTNSKWDHFPVENGGIGAPIRLKAKSTP